MADNIRPFPPQKNTGSTGDRRANRTIFLRTMFLMVFFGVLIFIPLLWKLWTIQIVDQDFYEQKAIEQQTKDSAVAADRGTIYDTNGNILAISATVHDIILSPRDVNKLQASYAEKVEKARENKGEYPEYPEPTDEFIALNLSQILGVEYDDIMKRLGKDSAYQVLAKKTEEEVSTKVREFITENKLTGGITVQPTSKRYYPYSSLAAHVLGFVNSENEGAYGLEAMYEEELSGEVGRVVTAKNGAGTELLFRYEDYIDALDGCDLTLTLDATIQHYCEKILEEGIAKYDIQNGGFAIAMDPNTGAIKGWANYPTYDLNSPSTIFSDMLTDELAALKASGVSDEEYSKAVGNARNQQWRNKAVNDTYEPGSTFKSVVLAAALEEGVVDVNDTFVCTGETYVNGERIRCHKRDGGHGVQTLAKAVQNSCNPAFVAIGQRLGAEKFYQYMEDFGILEKTGVDMQGESRSTVWPKDYFLSAEGYTSLATASFGQRFNVTPMQMLCATSAVINGGHLLTPHVLESITDSEGTVVKHVETTEVRQVISEQTSEVAREILESVVNGGTGKNAYVAGYRIGGKTGSSQTLEDDHTIVSFLGFAPANDPQIIILLALDNPKPNGPNSNYTAALHYISGGNMAAPLAGELLADILNYMGVEKQYTEAELSGADTMVPKVTDFPLTEAERLLKKSGFTWRTVGTGPSVTDQIPAAGATIPGNSEVVLYLGEPKPEKTVEVPNLSGMTAENARTALNKLGLYMKVTGASGYYTSATVAGNQSIAAGSQVALGTVVEVRFVDNHIYD